MKIFAIEKNRPGITFEDMKPYLKDELSYAWNLYKKNIIREFYFGTDTPGVILVLECVDVVEAKRVLSDLPFMKANLIEFEFMPVGAFTLFESLFAK